MSTMFWIYYLKKHTQPWYVKTVISPSPGQQCPEIQAYEALTKLSRRSLRGQPDHIFATTLTILNAKPNPSLLNCPIQPSVVGNLEPLAPDRSGLGLRGVRALPAPSAPILEPRSGIEQRQVPPHGEEWGPGTATGPRILGSS